MKKARITVLLSLVTFLELMFLGFGGSFISEMIKDDANEMILFWSSFWSAILVIQILYIY